MNKQKLISLLGAVLIFQLMLAIIVYWAGTGDDSGAVGEKLLAIGDSQLNSIRIEDGESVVELKKINQEWRLPKIDFPAAASKVTGFINKLVQMEKGWPQATSSEAAKRFKVSEKIFERKIVLQPDSDSEEVLYLGTSPNYRYIHARKVGKDEIYSVEFSAYEAGIKHDDWIDKEILKQNQTDLERISLGELVLVKDQNEWMLSCLKEDEQAAPQELKTFLDKLTGIQIDGLLGKENKKEYGLDKPEYTIDFKFSNNKKVVYQLSKPEGESYFVLKSSDLEHYFSVPAYTINPIIETERDKLVQQKEETDNGGAES